MTVVLGKFVFRSGLPLAKALVQYVIKLPLQFMYLSLEKHIIIDCHLTLTEIYILFEQFPGALLIRVWNKCNEEFYSCTIAAQCE